MSSFPVEVTEGKKGQMHTLEEDANVSNIVCSQEDTSCDVDMQQQMRVRDLSRRASLWRSRISASHTQTEDEFLPQPQEWKDTARPRERANSLPPLAHAPVHHSHQAIREADEMIINDSDSGQLYGNYSASTASSPSSQDDLYIPPGGYYSNRKNIRRRSSLLQSLVSTQKRFSSTIKRAIRHRTSTNMRTLSAEQSERGYCRELDSRRRVYMWNEQDCLLFDQLLEWKKQYPQCTKSQALQSFATLDSSADAVINILSEDPLYDYILKYDASNGFQPVRDLFEKQLLKRGVFLELETSLQDPQYVYMKIITPFRVLCCAAERYELRRPLQEPPVLVPQDVIQDLNSGLFKRWFDYSDEPVDLNVQSEAFKYSHLRLYRGISESTPDYMVMTQFFKPFYRALLTKYLIESVQIDVDAHSKSSALKNQTMGIHYLLSKGVYLAYFYPHDSLRPIREKDLKTHLNLREKVYNDWVKTFWKGKNMKEFRDYFGEKLALHFAFCLFYRNGLVLYALMGLIVSLYGVVDYSRNRDQDRAWRHMYDNELMIWFALFNSFWCTFFLEFWKRRNHHLSYVWLTYTFEAEEKPRHSFRATDMVTSPVTGLPEPSFPTKQRLWLQLQSACVISVLVLAVLGSLLAQMILTSYLSESSTTLSSEQISVFSGGFGLFLLFLLKLIYNPIAEYLNNRENHQTDTQYDNALIFKKWIFDFSNIFARLLYFAFIRPLLNGQGYFGNPYLSSICTGNCTTDLFIQVVFLFIGDVLIGRTSEYLIPLLYKKWSSVVYSTSKVHPSSLDAEAGVGMPLAQYYLDDQLTQADGADYDYLQKISQYGMLTSFSIVFPLAPLLMLINNTLEIHSDAYKYLVLHQRIPPAQAQDIGIWYSILKFHSVLAVSINAGIVVFLSEAFEQQFLQPYWPTESFTTLRFVYFVGWHILVHGLCELIAVIVPDVPHIVQLAKRRQRYLERKAHHLESQEMQNPSQCSVYSSGRMRRME